jgi:negative regulator of sigma E activity
VRITKLTRTSVALAALVSCLTAPAFSADTADTLVREAIDAPKHISYVGQLQTTSWGPIRATSTVTRVEHRAPGDTRKTFIAPPSIYGQYIITHGTASYQFDPQKKTVTTSQNPASDNPVAENDNIILLTANYRAVAGPDESVAGRVSNTVSLVNKFTGERTVRLWVDAQTHIVLAKELYHAGGSLISRVRFDDIRFTNDIPTGVFTRDTAGYIPVAGRNYAQPSTDLEATIKTAGFTPMNPKRLPEGFALVSADVSVIRTIKSLHFLYSDGVRDLSLFENAGSAAADFGALKPTKIHFEDHDGNYVSDGPTTLLSWREHGLAFALVGDLDIKELAAIAASVVP